MAKKKNVVVVADESIGPKLNGVVFLLNALADELKSRHPWAEYPKSNSRGIKRTLDRIGDELSETLRYMTGWSPGEIRIIRMGNHPLNEAWSPILKGFLGPPQAGRQWTLFKDGHYLRQIQTTAAHPIVMAAALSPEEKVEKLRQESTLTSGDTAGVTLFLPQISGGALDVLKENWNDFYETWTGLYGCGPEPVN